jgi:hypothetical protein
MSPLFAAARRAAPFGTRGMWGALADGLATGALQRARQTGRDGEAAWREVELLIDAIAARVPKLRVRPAVSEVEWSGGLARFAVRGTCCLYFKVAGDDAASVGESYCANCPLRDDDDRRRRWAAWLDEQAGT